MASLAVTTAVLSAALSAANTSGTPNHASKPKQPSKGPWVSQGVDPGYPMQKAKQSKWARFKSIFKCKERSRKHNDLRKQTTKLQCKQTSKQEYAHTTDHDTQNKEPLLSEEAQWQDGIDTPGRSSGGTSPGSLFFENYCDPYNLCGY